MNNTHGLPQCSRLLLAFSLLHGVVSCEAEPSAPRAREGADDDDVIRGEAELDAGRNTGVSSADADVIRVDAGSRNAFRDGIEDAASARAHDASLDRTRTEDRTDRDAAWAMSPSADRPSAAKTCADLPAPDDYTTPGPFADAKMFAGVGPDGNYTLFRPDVSLGRDGFRHPLVAWGNGASTTPDQFAHTLTWLASHGFVIVACNDTWVERPCMNDGMEWLLQQDASGPMEGKLDTTNEATIGWSWGGGAAIDTANRPNVRATISFHGMPPRSPSAFEDMHSPLLLFTSTGDSFVTASGYVTPNYNRATVQTFYATLDDPNVGHLYIVDREAISCAVEALLGSCADTGLERAPALAWLRLWQCEDEHARAFFFGEDCALCRSPWIMPQRKNWPANE